MNFYTGCIFETFWLDWDINKQKTELDILSNSTMSSRRDYGYGLTAETFRKVCCATLGTVIILFQVLLPSNE